MDKSLVKLAEQAADEEELVYAPDVAALNWMNKFAQMVAVKERESCAQKLDDAGYPDMAKLIRNGKW